MVAEFWDFFCVLGIVYSLFRGMLVVFVYTVSLVAELFPVGCGDWCVGGYGIRKERAARQAMCPVAGIGKKRRELR